ncbi:MAG: hypothetical protein KC657_29400 [Myxococcales bacterium]|nr:hypothetical protein [Myxococcales bacterium]
MTHGRGARVPWELAALALATLAYALGVVRDFSGPLVARGDASYFELLGAHLVRGYHFGFPPTIDFVTTDVGYPEGTSVVYLSWCAERDLLHMTMLRAFGPGPWLQLYVALSPAVSAAGIWALLRGEVGRARASVVAWAGAFMCFYAAFKFAYHLNMTALHWGAMSIVVDWLMVRRVVAGERIEARLVLARVALLAAVVGLDIGYVAGYPLTSFTVACIYMLAWLFTVGRRRGVTLGSVWPRGVAAEVRAHPWSFAFWGALLLVGVVFYVPFDLAVVRAATVYRFDGAGGNFWASQLRMLLPFFPGANPASGWVRALFGEDDGTGELSTGWALLAFMILGVVAAKKKRRLHVIAPLLVTFALCFAFHPARFRTLHVFPWFFFNRVAGRSTVFFPLWFALVGLEWLEGASLRARRALACVAAVETLTAWILVHDYAPARFTPEMGAYFAEVHRAPGEALLEWPFCIAGANGVGTSELCPYYKLLSTSYAYRRFHGKKVFGFYLSRVHPSQLQGRLRYASLFSPDDPSPHLARRETRCFDDARWATFDALLRSGDFGAIQLDVDLLPAECAEDFYLRFGAPVARATLPGPGRVELLVPVRP